MKTKKRRTKKTRNPELLTLAETIRTEARTLEGTHPKLVEAVNELCVTLARMGI